MLFLSHLAPWVSEELFVFIFSIFFIFHISKANALQSSETVGCAGTCLMRSFRTEGVWSSLVNSHMLSIRHQSSLLEH